VVHGAATRTLDLDFIRLPFAEQAIAIATTDFVSHIDLNGLAL
jgi:hypothetical protein